MGMESLMGAPLPFAAMITLEISEIGLITLSKAAMTSGLNSLVYCVYYNALGTFILFPFFIFHTRRRRSRGPPLSISLLARFFLLGLLGICGVQIFSNLGIKYSSPTLAAALGNLIPGFTFLLAVIFRMEKLTLRSSTNVAKIVGTIVSISGAFIVTFYKGPPIFAVPPSPTSPLQLSLHEKSNWVLGGLLLAITCLSSSSWNVVQTVIVKEYPEKMTLIFYSCLFGTIQCAVISLLVENDLSAWTLHSDIQMIAVLYAAICGTVFRNSIFPWCLDKKGPVFVALFKPLGTAIAVVMGVMFLGETPHVGSLIGALVITLGFYAVMWGQAKDSDVLGGKSDSLESSTQKTPLLQAT